METKNQNINKALIKFHQEVGRVAKNSDNPYFKSKYGDLNAYLDVIKTPLANCGLTIVQMPVTNGLKTVLAHETGESYESECTIPDLKADPQKLGAAITYLRRYMIASMLMLNAEDDDGNAFTQKPGKQKNGADAKKQAIEYAKKIFGQLCRAQNPNDAVKQFIANVDLMELEQINHGISQIESLLKK